MKIKFILSVLTIAAFIGLTNCNKSQETSSSGDTSTKISIPGTGANQDLLRVLSQKYMELNPGEVIDIPASTGSSGGIKAVIEKKANVARVARKLKDKEAATGLTYEEFAVSPVVFASNPAIKIKNLKTSDILKIYSGKITNWKELGGKDQKIIVIGRVSGDSSRDIIEKVIKEFKTLSFPANMSMPKTDQDMINALKITPGAIGFGTFANMKTERLNIFNLDGNVAGTGQYTLMGPYAFVYYKDKLSPLSKKFLDFVFSNEGKKVIESQFCLGIPRSK